LKGEEKIRAGERKRPQKKVNYGEKIASQKEGKDYPGLAQ